MEGTGTRNTVFTERILSERAIKMKKDLYISCTDYTIVFVKVRHEDFLKLLENVELDGKDICIIRNLY